LAKIVVPKTNSIGNLSINEWTSLWSKLPQSQRSLLREFYQEMVNLNIGNAKKSIAIELKSWKARSDVKLLRDVLEWNETKGALTNAEAELIRLALLNPIAYELNDSLHAGRVLTWTIFETLKRGTQIARLSVNDLKLISSTTSHAEEWILTIPTAKAQTGQSKNWWPISVELAIAIQNFRKRPNISRLSEKYLNLILWETIDLERGWLSAQSIGDAINGYLKRLKITSPRTNKIITLTPNRIRHTGATLLAKNGVSRDVLQTILEHDSMQSANSYIDACGSELVPAIDRVDRATNTFSMLADTFFKGEIGSKKDKSQIYLPVINLDEQPTIVGNCGKNSYCPRNPFFACYDGCSDFVAWREADHNRALTFVKSEQKRWASAENKQRVNAPKNFERLQRAIEEVIKRIKDDTNNG
jgi:integrase